MKQILQSFKTGETILEEVPVPVVKYGSLLIKTTRSLVSSGTEKMLVEFGKSNLISKALQQPERVRQVLDKIKSDGLIPSVTAVLNKLDQPIPLGYCNVGRVIQIGDGVQEFMIGDRVASNGPHAEFVCIPKNLVVKIPENVTDDQASFTVLGSIGLQGVRLFNPTFGETVVVIGLGLIGLLTVQMLNANGCNVIGIDLDAHKCELAQSWGVTVINPSTGSDPVNTVMELTHNTGCDGVIITASSHSNEVISQAARMTRKRGRIILIGVIGLELNRSEFYEKEITFQVSCSYGPGRYDDNYEKNGNDYPAAYVRWTEKRNFEAVLSAISRGNIKVDQLISDKIKLEDYNTFYENLKLDGNIATIFEYDENAEFSNQIILSAPSMRMRNGAKTIAVIGAGNFASATIIPMLKKINAPVKYIASANGVSARTLSKKGKIEIATSDYNIALEDKSVGLVIIATRHNNHAQLCIKSLNAGKHVFVEKPLALNRDQLNQIIQKYNADNTLGSISVGFNRRFSPLTEKMKKLLFDGPVNIIATMNAGFIPSNSWLHDPEIGGGRIIGEACHYIDLCQYLAGSRIKAVCMNSLGTDHSITTDNASILLKFENGSNAVINYFSNGSKRYSKERVEVYQQQKTLIMDNWRSLTGYGFKGFNRLKIKQDKGHLKQFMLLNDFIQNGGSPIISFQEIVNTTRASFAAVESLQKGCWIDVE